MTIPSAPHQATAPPTGTAPAGTRPAAAPRRAPRIEDILDLTPLQQGLLFHAEFDDTEEGLYSIQLGLRLEGGLDTAALWRAVDALFARHANLRAAFRHRRTGEPVQIIPDRVRVPCVEHDLSGLDPARAQSELERLAERQRTTRFDLGRPPALRFALVRLAETRHHLILTCHHILLDGWSLPLLVDELGTLYRTAAAGGRVPDDAGLPDVAPYRDHLTWLAGRDTESAKQEWRRALEGVDGPTYLVPGGRATGVPVKRQLTLSAAVSGRLTDLARGRGLTLNTVVQGAWGILLGRLTRRDDVIFGAVVSGRPPELPGAERMIGLFINTIPLRVRTRQDEPVAELLSRLQDEQSRLFEHQHVGLAETQRLASAGDLFDTLLLFQNYPSSPDEDVESGGLRIVATDSNDATHYPVSLMAVPGDEMLLDLTYRADAAVPGGAERLLGRLAAVLEQIARSPDIAVGDLDVVSADERALLLDEWNHTPGERAPVPPGVAAPIGRPIPRDRAYVLGPGGELLPPEVMGELHLAGAGLARGYINRPALTAAAFVPDPFGPPGTRMYRTGDLARWRADGQIEYLGRADHQVKIRGYRVELAEIEAVLAGHPALTGAAVLAREDTPGHKRLVGYAVARPGDRPGDDELRRHIGARLPDYMVPSVFVWLDSLPVTTHGKVDRKALPAPGSSGTGTGPKPRTAKEKALCAAIGEVLDVPDVTLDDNLFDLGCDSLTAALLIGRVNAALGLRLNIRSLYESPTAAGILAEAGADKEGASAAGLDTLLPIRADGGRAPLFCFHPGSGLSWCYTGFARHLGPDQPILGLQAAILVDPDAAPDTVEHMAERCLELMRRVQPSGPYRLLGWSFGGVVAHAVACLLQQRGERVEFVALLDSFPLASPDGPDGGHTPADERRLFAEGLGLDPAPLAEGEITPRRVLDAASAEGNALSELDEQAVTALMKAAAHHIGLMSRHTPGVFHGDVLSFDAGSGRPVPESSAELWRPFVTGAIENHVVAGPHMAMTSPRALDHIGPIVSRRLSGTDD
ncbi:hypothetical protein GCM10010329_38170 [Streptomyces spiroverticillatus]|uniref:Carrier domain-containing protein n=1 Tax=Streptomyces finlayi TaxID=67296 RepID=A0A918WY57_9ACTN|nr:condensation domain-containing protein [Streptomyces finlayi]GHA11637.1 hypothetical protein GCM10010329_38170 [Streptomyces spiroverticillatus]GHC94923.1 hypothetical protein GCM10010334_33440 [Streptomyces finlayi]